MAHIATSPTTPSAVAADLESDAWVRDAVVGGRLTIWSFDVATGQLHVSDHAKVVLGLSRDAIPTDLAGLRARIHPDDQARFDAAVRAVLEGPDGACSAELRLRHADGRWMWIQTQCSVVARAPDGAPLRVAGTNQDISAHKSAELALARSEERLSLVLRGANDAPWDLNLVTGETFFSDRWWEMLGLSLEARAEEPNAWMHSMHPDDVGPANAVVERAMALGLENFESEFRMRHADGRWVSVLSRGFIVRDATGTPVRLCGTNTDLTDRRRAEAAERESHALMAAFIRHSPIYAFIMEASATESRVIQASENFVQLIGVPGSKMVGKSLVELFPPENAAKFVADDWHVMSSGEVFKCDEDFNGRNYETVKFPIVLGGGRTLLAGYVIDVTERKRTEAATRALEHQLHEAQKNDSLGVMAAGIAHQFNNLLMSIQGYLEHCRARDPGSADPMLADAEAAALRAATISGSMLSYLGQGELHPEPRNLSRDVTDLLPLLRAALPPTVRLETALAEDVPWCTIDPAGVRRVVQNLATNAWEAVEARGGSVWIAARRVSELPNEVGSGAARRSGPWACLEVRDDGPGMDADTRDRMFDPFFSTKFTGRGLGLPAALGIIRACDGTLHVETAPGRGTVVRVYLPESTASALASLRPVVAPEPSTATVRTPRGPVVLVVDDDPLVLHANERILRRLGYEVLTAEGGAQGIAAFRAQPDAIGSVVLDLSMPDVDGWQVLAEIRALRPQTYVVVASGYDVAQLRHEPRAHQPDGWLQKPFGVSDVAALLPKRSAR